MYQFTKEEKDFLRRFGQTGNSKEFLALLEKIKVKADSTSSIPKDSDYGAQVEGRRIVHSLLSQITDSMERKEPRPGDRQEVGVDEFD